MSFIDTLPNLDALEAEATKNLNTPCPTFGPITVLNLVERIRVLEAVVFDICEPTLHTPHAINAETGMSATRCEAMAAIINEILNRK